jgi:hypothetical protein
VNERKLKNLVLPPQVSGKSHGNLELIIEKIRWTTTKKFSEVEIRLKWWGECEGISVKFSQAQSIRYQINTNYRLLQSYLTHCEPIRGEIFSIKNKDLVGRVFIGIPAKLHNLEDPVGSLRGVFNILSARDFKIGEMSVCFGVNFTPNQVLSIKTHPEKESNKKVTFKLNDKKTSSSNKENFSVVGVKMPMSVRQPKPSTLKSKNVIPINQKATRRSSQSSSSISEPLSDIKVSTPSSESIIDSNDNFMIDSIRIAVNSLNLNCNGHSEVRKFIDKLHNRKSIVKCAVTSKLIKVQRGDDSNFISYVFDSASQSEYIQ